MTIEAWATKPESYLALATLISFMVALFLSIGGFFSILVNGMIAVKKGNGIRWAGMTWIIVFSWSVFAIFKYFMGVVIR